MRQRTSLLGLALATSFVVGGCDAPLGPETPIGPTEPIATDAPPPPAFLIGQSPLIALVKTPGGLEPYAVRVNVQVNRGVVQTKDDDRFQLRTTVRLSKDGDELFIDVCVHKPAPDKDADIRGGKDVPVTIYEPLSAEQFNVLLGAAPDEGDTIDAYALVELILTDGAGKEHILDSASATAPVDPKDAV